MQAGCDRRHDLNVWYLAEIATPRPQPAVCGALCLPLLLVTRPKLGGLCAIMRCALIRVSFLPRSDLNHQFVDASALESVAAQQMAVLEVGSCRLVCALEAAALCVLECRYPQRGGAADGAEMGCLVRRLLIPRRHCCAGWLRLLPAAPRTHAAPVWAFSIITGRSRRRTRPTNPTCAARRKLLLIQPHFLPSAGSPAHASALPQRPQPVLLGTSFCFIVPGCLPPAGPTTHAGTLPQRPQPVGRAAGSDALHQYIR